MTRSQGPIQGPSATASISMTREAGGWNGLCGHKTRSRLPQTSLQGQDRQDCFKMFLWAQQNKHGTPGRDMWTGSTGLGIAAAGGLEL